MNKLEHFLEKVYASIWKRRDSYLQLGLALASSEHVESIVGLSESVLYERGYGNVYETLRSVEQSPAAWTSAMRELLAKCCETPGGVAIFSGDSTFIRRTEAVTLAERSYKRSRSGELLQGQESYWTMQIADSMSSWCGVFKVERMVDKSVTELAAAHLTLLDEQAHGLQLYVLDAGHGKAVLESYAACHHTDVVMRVKSNQVFHGKPPVYKGKGRPALHGKRYKLAEMPEAEQTVTTEHKRVTLEVQRWSDLHYQGYADVHGCILRLRLLDNQGKPVHATPIWLFSTNITLDPLLLAQAYLTRASHELTFRFMKQHLSLKNVQSPSLEHVDAHLNLVALAMNLLLASRDYLQPRPNPWYPRASTKPISQRHAQKVALPFFLKVSSPIKTPRPAGKGSGRPKGFTPKLRTRFPITRKTSTSTSPCPTCPLRTAV